MNAEHRLLCKTQARQADAHLEALLVEGLTCGVEIPLAQQFWTELRRDAAETLAGQKQPGKARAKK
jgi:hypothetical protein